MTSDATIQKRTILGTLNPMYAAASAAAQAPCDTVKKNDLFRRGSKLPVSTFLAEQQAHVDSENDEHLESTTEEGKLQQFKTVCTFKTGEDLDDDLSASGLELWTNDDFEFIRTLGSGGTANVYCAREKMSGYKIALKVMEDLEDAICEIDIHQPLEHPNVVKMYDYFFSDSPFGPVSQQNQGCDEDSDAEDDLGVKKYLILILELCEEGSLFDLIRDQNNRRLDERTAARYFKGAIEAMEYIHSQNLIHCDCKSLNFLVSNGILKLADFGMTVRNDEKEVVGGSPVFMAPEHLAAWRHATDDFDHKSDIYSLGMVLYEILAGYLPYEVIQDDDSEEDILALGLGNLLLDGRTSIRLPILDLRELDDDSSTEDLYVPPPIFPGHFSQEVCDLISCLTQSSRDQRMSLAEAKNHKWFKMMA